MNDINTKLKYGYINPLVGIGIVCSTVILVLGVGVAGALLGSEYESSCSAKSGEEPVCTTRYAYKGLGNLDLSLPSLQTAAVAIGAGFAAYATVKSGKLPVQLKNMFDGEEATP